MTASNIFDPRPTTYYDENGQIASGAKAFFFLANTNSPVVVYEDQALTTPHAFPVVANSRGVLPVVYVPYAAGAYRVLIRSAADITIYDAPYIANDAPPSSGGGLVVTATQIFRTGFAMWAPQTGPLDGFVRMNGRTIGSTSSGATEYAGDTAKDLFGILWGRISDTYAPVSSGRGASADADWSANKTIVVPSMQGRVAVGADDMGASASNTIQVQTTISVTNGVNTGTASSAAGLARGMKCVIDTANKMTISAISGSVVTFTAVYPGSTNASASLRASFFQDAQAPGAAGGTQTITQTKAEMPAHDHDWADLGHQHGLQGLAAYANGAAVAISGGGTGGNTATATTGITFNSAGQGLPTQLIQPGLIGTYYIKL